MSIDYSLFALVHAPQPLGFYLIADREIPTDTRLFDYGGEKINSGRTEKHYRALEEQQGQKFFIWRAPVHTKKKGVMPPPGYILDNIGRTICR